MMVNQCIRQVSIDYSYGIKMRAVCNYSNINSSMNLGNPPGFEVLLED